MKKHNKKLVLLTAFGALCLGGCGEKSVEDFMNDPAALQETLQECLVGKTTGKECDNAAQASLKMTQGAMQGLMKGLGQ